MRHNNIRDYEAELLKQTQNDVETEPPLQPLNGEQIPGLTGDEVRPDIRARGVWRNGQNAYFDIRVTNTNAEAQKHIEPMKILEKHEKEKKRQYNARIMNIEHGTFTPLVFSVCGSLGPECSKFHKHLANKISMKSGEPYEKIFSIIRCRLSFLILRASLMCIRGSRSASRPTAPVDDFAISFDVVALEIELLSLGACV